MNLSKISTAVHYRDCQDLLAAFKGKDDVPEAIADAEANIVNNPNFGLRDVNRRNAIYRGVMCLVALQGTRDFRADDSIEFHTLDDHHIFPRAFLQRVGGYPSDLINSVVNRTLIAASTNRSISRSSPSQYLERLIPSDYAAAILDSHLIDADALAAMQADDFEWFF